MIVLAAAAACATVTSTYAGAPAEPAIRTGMGLVIYDCNLRRSWMRQQEPDFDLFNPLNFLKHCHALGAGGMQANLGVLKPSDVDALRKFAGQHGLFIDAIVKPPNDDADLGRFEAEIKTAREVGVQAARTTIIPGRRYESFKTLEEFREFERRGQQMLQRVAPVVEKHRVPFAVVAASIQFAAEELGL